MPEPSLLFDRFEVRPAERALWVDGQPVELGSRAFDLLLVLIAHRDRVVAKDELLEKVWPGLVVEENNLQVQISTLRKLLGAQTIATIPGRGYQWVAPPLEKPAGMERRRNAADAFPPPTPAAPMSSPAPVPAPGSAPAPAPAGAPSQLRSMRVAMLAVVALAVTLAAGLAAWRHTDDDTGRVETAPTPLSIVVLPFANHTGDAERGHIADGITASLISDLARLRDTIVINAATAFTYKGKTATAQELGKELGVRFVLQGDVQRSGARLRINTQLADTSSGRQLWSETFEGEQSDLFNLQDQLIGRVGISIGREMVKHVVRAGVRNGRDTDVVDLLLRARALRFQPQSRERHDQLMSLYRRVLELEPDNSRALVGLATSLMLRTSNDGYDLDRETAKRYLDEAHRLAMRAIELDPGDDEVYSVIAAYAGYRGDRAGWRQAAEKRLLLAPRSLGAHNEVALWHFYAGDADQAIVLLKKGRDLDPINNAGGIEFNLGRAYFMKRDYDEAIRWFNSARARRARITVVEAYLAMAYTEKGESALAATAREELRRRHPNFNEKFFSRPTPSTPEFDAYWQDRLLPAAKRAGLFG